jgi:hypothetical protein
MTYRSVPMFFLSYFFLESVAPVLVHEVAAVQVKMSPLTDGDFTHDHRPQRYLNALDCIHTQLPELTIKIVKSEYILKRCVGQEELDTSRRIRLLKCSHIAEQSVIVDSLKRVQCSNPISRGRYDKTPRDKVREKVSRRQRGFGVRDERRVGGHTNEGYTTKEEAPGVRVACTEAQARGVGAIVASTV